MNAARTTRQGVRDLNPPGQNGKKPQCQCKRDPQTATRVEQRIREVTLKDNNGNPVDKVLKSVGVHLCVFCGTERYSEHDEES